MSRITFRDALVASNEEERIIDTIVLDVFYQLSSIDESPADVETIYHLVNFDVDGSRLLDDSGEPAELITHQRIEKAIARASRRCMGYLGSLQAFHAGQSEIGLLEAKTFLHRGKDEHGDGYQYSLVTPHGSDVVNIQLSEKEAMQIAGDWIEHYDVGHLVEAM